VNPCDGGKFGIFAGKFRIDLFHLNFGYRTHENCQKKTKDKGL
jgi:hypothetical protein